MKKYKINNKVIILGTAGSLDRTPWDRKDYDYWACSPVLSYDYAVKKRIDIIFEIHQRQHWDTEHIKKMLNDYIKLNSKSIIYMQKQFKVIKNSVEYPLQEIQDYVNHDKLGKYLTSSIGMMVALAVVYEYERIELWGCHMSALEEEYSLQRAGVEAWLNFGLGKGIDYWVTEESDIMHCKYMYGYDQQKDILIKLMNYKTGLGIANEQLIKNERKAHDECKEQTGAIKIINKLIHEVGK